MLGAVGSGRAARAWSSPGRLGSGDRNVRDQNPVKGLTGRPTSPISEASYIPCPAVLFIMDGRMDREEHETRVREERRRDSRRRRACY
jgi:hypothetical protein